MLFALFPVSPLKYNVSDILEIDVLVLKDLTHNILFCCIVILADNVSCTKLIEPVSAMCLLLFLLMLLFMFLFEANEDAEIDMVDLQVKNRQAFVKVFLDAAQWD